MKKLFSLLFACSFILSIQAQEQLVANADMENWIALDQGKEAPLGWITRNQVTGNYSRLYCQKSEDAYSGDYAVQMLNHHQGNACYSSSIRIGNFDSNNPSKEGIAFSERPAGLAFYYTYNGKFSINPDFPEAPFYGKASITLTKWDDSTNEQIIIGEGYQYFGSEHNTTEFEYAEIEVDYFSNELPDTLQIIFKNPCDNYDSTQFTIDYVGLVGMNPTNTEEVTLLHEIEVFPNPASDALTFKTILGNEKNALIRIVDLQGKIIEGFNFTGNEKTIDVSQWTNGIYFYQVLQDGKLEKTGKLMIQK